MAPAHTPCVIIDGKALAEDILLGLRKRIVTEGLTPGLAVILVGNDAPSKQYIENKKKACHKVGIEFHSYLFSQNATKDLEQSILDGIAFLNNDPAVSGIIVQLPLPEGYDTQKIISAIDPAKDADGFHPENIKKILAGREQNLPPLVATLLHILKSQGIELRGKRAAILGRSDVFATIVKKAFSAQGATVERVAPDDQACLAAVIKSADIVIPMAGQPEFLTGDMLKPGAVVLDVGVTKTQQGYKGDADIASIKKVASYATPTPGGVGPVTVAMLLKSVVDLTKK